MCDVFWSWGKCPQGVGCKFVHVSHKWYGKKEGISHPVKHSILCPFVAKDVTSSSMSESCESEAGKDKEHASKCHIKFCPFAHRIDELFPYGEETRLKRGRVTFRVDTNASKPITVEISS